jgi:hypothetical protein
MAATRAHPCVGWLLPTVSRAVWPNPADRTPRSVALLPQSTIAMRSTRRMLVDTVGIAHHAL